MVVPGFIFPARTVKEREGKGGEGKWMGRDGKGGEGMGREGKGGKGKEVDGGGCRPQLSRVYD